MSVAARSSVSTPSRSPAAGSWNRSRLGFSRTLSSAWASASSSRSISPRSARVRSSHSVARRGSGARRPGRPPSRPAGRPSGGSGRRSRPWRAAPAAARTAGPPASPAAAPTSVSVIRLVAAACESTEKISMALIGTSSVSSRQPQHQAQAERARDEQAEHPPAERDVGGDRDGGQHARGDADHPLDGAADRVEQGRLHDQQRGQRGQHGARRRRRAAAVRAGRRTPP